MSNLSSVENGGDPTAAGPDPVLSHLKQAEEAYRQSQAASPPGNSDTAGATPAQGETVVIAADPVLSNIKQAGSLYVGMRASADRQAEELKDAKAQIADAKVANRQLAQDAQADQEQTQQEREKSDRLKERNKRLAESLKGIHRAMFRGNIYELILQSCLTLTGGTRGLYITSHDGGDTLRIRAAIDVDGYPQAPPSEFIRTLTRKVLDGQETFVCGEAGSADIPEPSNLGETFRNCMVVPVMLLKKSDGVLIVADKPSGEFDEDDTDAMLSIGDQASVAIENAQLQRELQESYLSTVSMLADAVEAKDPYTRGHCDLVSRYARLTADRLDLDEFNRGMVCYAALLHDIGKIGVSDGVLNKPGPLLPEERALVQSHVRVGHDLIARVPALRPIANIVLYHHEWYDGSGYPEGRRGEDIPLPARIVGVADTYCAMITRRSYKDAYTDQQARDELRRCAGTQFDPQVVEAFLAVLDTPEAQDMEDDLGVECGVIPGFNELEDMDEAR